ncbi:MAG: DUF3341 domain-containing protein [Bacteroidia bacterium]|nr:DUF3341 domain-containing protein [Bacteroidia bacterium]
MGLIDKNLSLRNRRKLILGIFDDEDKLMDASSALVHEGVHIQDVYTPYPVHGLDRIIGVKRSNLSVVAFLCGLTGFSLACLMIWYMYVYDWPMNIGNKPERFTPSWIPIMFESTVLCTAYGMGFFFFIRNRLLHGIQPELLHDRQTDDTMVICIETGDGVNESKIVDIMRSKGATEVRERNGGVQTTI